jgi:EmrB/QacA subfamily drug resistance transporter
LVATIIGSSLAFIDSTVINIALPALQADLNATVFDVQWVVEIYVLFMAALILVGGALGDRYGRRLIYAIGVALFAVSSLWCGLAASIGQLIVARALQGIGAALLVPGSLAIINATFDIADRGQAIGTWSGFAALTTALGPVVGGWFIEHVSWRWVFFLNTPLAAIVLVILFWHVPESRNRKNKTGLDWLGAALATIGLGGVVYGLIESSRLGFLHPLVVGASVGGIIALVGFAIVEARVSSPMLPLHLFRSRTFSGANLLTFSLYGGLGVLLFFLPFNLIQVQGYSAIATGAAFLPFVLAVFLFSRWAGRLADSHGVRPLLVAGTTITTIGFVLFMLPGVGGSYWLTFFPGVVTLGLGMAVCIPPLTTAAIASVDIAHSGIASGVNNAVSRVAGLLAIAVLGIVVLVVFNVSLDSSLAWLNVPPDVQTVLDAERVKLAGAKLPETMDPALKETVALAIKESFVAGFRVAMLVGAGLSFISILVAAFYLDDSRPEYIEKPKDSIPVVHG